MLVEEEKPHKAHMSYGMSTMSGSRFLDMQGKLWERVDEQWIACLRHASVEDWLQLPSGLVQVKFHITVLDT